ncbi:MAG TPA: YceI family protein [Polyangiaceae bacterium]|jgi:polyisoprenoid-binding protein YceI|nr:YceI family protein [Polyangiaceae bacterium]
MNAPRPNAWTLDAGHSAIAFSVRHLMITNVRGAFARFTAQVTYDAVAPAETRIDARIDVASIDTREAKRDDDLRGELFFDVAKHPTMTFVSKSARAVNDGIDIDGELTIRGVSRPVTLSVRDISGPAVDMRGHRRLGATATTKIKRTDFGMTWNKTLDSGGVVVGEVVTITIDVSLVATA